MIRWLKHLSSEDGLRELEFIQPGEERDLSRLRALAVLREGLQESWRGMCYMSKE